MGFLNLDLGGVFRSAQKKVKTAEDLKKFHEERLEAFYVASVKPMVDELENLAAASGGTLKVRVSKYPGEVTIDHVCVAFGRTEDMNKPSKFSFLEAGERAEIIEFNFREKRKFSFHAKVDVTRYDDYKNWCASDSSFLGSFSYWKPVYTGKISQSALKTHVQDWMLAVLKPEELKRLEKNAAPFPTKQVFSKRIS